MLRVTAAGIFIWDSDQPNVRSNSPTINEQQNRKPLEPGLVASRRFRENGQVCPRQTIRFAIFPATTNSIMPSSRRTWHIKQISETLLTGDTAVSDFKGLSTGELQVIADNVGDFDRTWRRLGSFAKIIVAWNNGVKLTIVATSTDIIGSHCTSWSESWPLVTHKFSNWNWTYVNRRFFRQFLCSFWIRRDWPTNKK